MAAGAPWRRRAQWHTAFQGRWSGRERGTLFEGNWNTICGGDVVRSALVPQPPFEQGAFHAATIRSLQAKREGPADARQLRGDAHRSPAADAVWRVELRPADDHQQQ